jgi:hypothetical protein
LLLRRVHRKAPGDPVGEIARRRIAELVGEGALSTCVVRHGHDREEVCAERFARDARAVGGPVAIGLVEVPHLTHEIGLGVRDQAFDGEATLAAGHDVRATVGQRRLSDDLRLGPDVVRFRSRSDLVAAPDEDDPEGALPLDAASDQEAVTRLEDVERHERAGEKHRSEREEREEFAHVSTVLSLAVQPDALATLLERALQFADAPNVRAVVLLGSLAREQGGPWSDIDLERWVATDAECVDAFPRYVDGRLLMINTVSVDHVRAELRSARRAIWAVPAYRAMRVVVDRFGDAAAISRAVESFEWESVTSDAHAFVRLTTAKSAEYVHKIRGATDTRDDWAALHAARALSSKCLQIVAVARRTFIETENEYFRVVCEAAGPNWTKTFRASLGVGETCDVFAQASAACRLYAETSELVAEVLDEQTNSIVASALALVAG